MWCATCDEEVCCDGNSISTICSTCGDTLRDRRATSDASNAGSTATRTPNYYPPAMLNLLRLANVDLLSANNSADNDGREAELWEALPPEAMDPTAFASSASRGTSEECIQRIPRIKIGPHSAVLHEAILTCTVLTANNNNDQHTTTKRVFKLNATVAEFGPLPPYRISGTLLLSAPITGADASHSRQTQQTREQLESRQNNILYMERGGGITFVQKAMYAQQRYHAKAVVCANNVAVWPYIMNDSTHREGNELSIPIVMIQQCHGHTLRTLLLESTTTIQVTLTVDRLTGGEECCVVCKDSFSIGGTVIRLPFCAHVFHEECALYWLKEHNTCPSCRRELPTDDTEYEIERRSNRNNDTTTGGESNDSWRGLFG